MTSPILSLVEECPTSRYEGGGKPPQSFCFLQGMLRLEESLFSGEMHVQCQVGVEHDRLECHVAEEEMDR